MTELFKKAQEKNIHTALDTSGVLFNKENIDVICVPTHHFCNLGCKMCHLTNNKLNKKMIPIKKEEFYPYLLYRHRFT